MGAAKTPSDLKWICLRCWRNFVAKSDEALPTGTLRDTSAECGVEKVAVMSVRKDSNWPITNMIRRHIDVRIFALNEFTRNPLIVDSVGLRGGIAICSN